MIARLYEPKDFEQIQVWAKHRGTEYTESQFPKVGFIVDGYAAYFLYQTDSTVCFLENLIANPLTEGSDRCEAIDLVVDAVISEAKALGFTVAYATSGLPAVIFRGLRHGAQPQTNQVLLTKKLVGPSK